MPERGVSTRQRRRVAERAGRRCEYCLSPADYAPDPFVVEHIVPRVRGGQTHFSNLAYACQGCNNHTVTVHGIGIASLPRELQPYERARSRLPGLPSPSSPQEPPGEDGVPATCRLSDHKLACLAV